MKKKLILPLVFILSVLSFSFVNAQESITLQEAYSKALNNDDRIFAQREITNNLKDQYEKYKDQFDYEKNHYSDALGNIHKVPYNFVDKAEYNYKDLKRNELNTLKSMIVGNKEKTFNLFVNEITLRNDIKNLKSQIAFSKTLENQEKSKYNLGVSIKVNVLSSALSLDDLNNQLFAKENQLKLNEKQFEDHTGIKNCSKLEFVITPVDKIMVPKEALDKAQKEKVSFDNMNHEIESIENEINLYEKGPGYLMTDAKLRKEDLDKKVDDLKDLKKNTLNRYENFYYDILIGKNQLSSKVIEYNQLLKDKKYHSLLFDSGIENRNNLQNVENKILDNFISREKIQLNIDKIAADYLFDTEN